MHTVLIAEDDAAIAGNLSKALSRKGINALVTANGIEAVEFIKEHKPAVVLLDINLPGISGIKVLEEAKKTDKEIKIIVITGTFDSETEKQAKDCGVYAFLKKPFMIEVVFKLLGDLKIIA